MGDPRGHAADAASSRREERAGRVLDMELESLVDRAGMSLLKMTLFYRGYEVFMVVNAHSGGDNTDFVAFYTGSDAAGAVTGFAAKLRQGKVKWKKDKPYEPKVKKG